MMDDLFRPETIAFGLLVIVYVIGRKYIEAKEKRLNPISDEACLAAIAARMHCSEYDLFLKAAKIWHLPEVQTVHDFKQYLLQGNLPHYVRDYIRKNRSNDESDRNILNPGGTIPGGWSA